MNLVDCYVTRVLTNPKQIEDEWVVRVEYNSYGRLSDTFLAFSTMQEALEVKEGYHFLS